MKINRFSLDRRIQEWLYEDMPYGDVTTQNLDLNQQEGMCRLQAKETGVICGQEVFERVQGIVDEKIEIEWLVLEGSIVQEGDVIANIKGPFKSLLMAERLSLNLLAHMSGIATKSRAYHEARKEREVRLVDTRKTTPGLRDLEKYAVTIGGCHNHRMSLSEAVMLKDNHIAAVGSIQQAVDMMKKTLPHTMKIELEVSTLKELEEALVAEVDIVMLDNMSTEMMAEAVAIAKGRVLLEASGNMHIERIREVAETGVDIISIGELTHTVKALDISMKFL